MKRRNNLKTRSLLEECFYSYLHSWAKHDPTKCWFCWHNLDSIQCWPSWWCWCWCWWWRIVLLIRCFSIRPSSAIRIVVSSHSHIEANPHQSQQWGYILQRSASEKPFAESRTMSVVVQQGPVITAHQLFSIRAQSARHTTLLRDHSYNTSSSISFHKLQNIIEWIWIWY